MLHPLLPASRLSGRRSRCQPISGQSPLRIGGLSDQRLGRCGSEDGSGHTTAPVLPRSAARVPSSSVEVGGGAVSGGVGALEGVVAAGLEGFDAVAEVEGVAVPAGLAGGFVGVGAEGEAPVGEPGGCVEGVDRAGVVGGGVGEDFGAVGRQWCMVPLVSMVIQMPLVWMSWWCSRHSGTMDSMSSWPPAERWWVWCIWTAVAPQPGQAQVRYLDMTARRIAGGTEFLRLPRWRGLPSRSSMTVMHPGVAGQPAGDVASEFHPGGFELGHLVTPAVLLERSSPLEPAGSEGSEGSGSAGSGSAGSRCRAGGSGRSGP